METHDTLLELQEQLKAQNAKGAVPPASRADTEKRLEDIISHLATKAGFEVKAVLGVGGMGAVVRAVDLQLKREVALKFLPPETVKDPAKVAELRAEAEIVSRIKHENVVSILSWHEQDSVPFYAMELVEGESLMDQVRRAGKLPVPEALRIIIEAANGVEALHGLDVIHRDIKPQNILISREGRVKITDFGISRTQSDISQEARVSKIAGTPQFMAPEQARGEAASKHSDIYGLAATLYFCLSGRTPVRAVSDIREQLRIVGEGRPVPIGNHLPKLNREVARVVMKGLNPVPARRAWDLAAWRQDAEAAYIAQMKDQGGGLAKFFRNHGRWMFPTAMLALGLAGGFVAGRHGHVAPPAVVPVPPPVAASPPLPLDVLRQLGREDAEAMRLIMALDTPHSERRQALVGDYDKAMTEANVAEVARLATQLGRERELWLARVLARLVGTDPTTNHRAEAMALLDPANAGNEEALLLWRRTWIAYLDDLVKAREAMFARSAPGPAPQQPQTPAPGAASPRP